MDNYKLGTDKEAMEAWKNDPENNPEANARRLKETQERWAREDAGLSKDTSQSGLLKPTSKVAVESPVPKTNVVQNDPSELMDRAKTDKVEDKKVKQTDKLIKVMTDLTKFFKKDEKAKGPTVDKNGAPTTLIGKIKAGVTEKVKDKFSAKGLMNMAGMGEGTLVGGSILQHIDQKKADKVEQEQHKANFLKYTDKGRELAALTGVPEKEKQAKIDEAAKIHREQAEEDEKELAKIKQDEQDIKKLDKNLELDDTVIKRRTKLETDKASRWTNPNGTQAEVKATVVPVAKQEETAQIVPQVEPAQSREDMVKEIAANLMKELDTQGLQQQEEERRGTPFTPEESTEFKAGVLEGLMDDLLKSSDEQLEVLKELYKSAEQSEEEKLETDKGNNLAVNTNDKKVGDSKTEKDKPKSLVDKLTDMAGDSLGESALGKAGKAAGGLAKKVGGGLLRMAGPAAAVAGAGAAGYAAGSYINEKLGISDKIVDSMGDIGGGDAINKISDIVSKSRQGKITPDEAKFVKDHDAELKKLLAIDKDGAAAWGESKGGTVAAPSKAMLEKLAKKTETVEKSKEESVPDASDTKLSRPVSDQTAAMPVAEVTAAKEEPKKSLKEQLQYNLDNSKITTEQLSTVEPSLEEKRKKQIVDMQEAMNNATITSEHINVEPVAKQSNLLQDVTSGIDALKNPSWGSLKKLAPVIPAAGMLHNIGKIDPLAALSPPPVANRESLGNQLDNSQKQSEKITREKEKAPTSAPVITNVTNNNSSNTTKETRMSPPVRNFDSSFLDRLGTSYN